MESRQTPSAPSPARAIAALALCGAVILSIALACVGCSQFAPGTSNPQGSSASQQPSPFLAPEDLLAVSESAFTPPPPPEPEPEPEPKPLSYLAKGSDLMKLSGSESPYAFALAEGDAAPGLSDASASVIEDAVGYFAELEWVSGYLLVDLETGRGVAGNLDERVFSASAIKGPFVHFLCEKWLDTGRASLEDKLAVGDEEMTLKELIEDAILKSGNESYKVLFSTYGSGWGSWLDQLGIASEINAYQRNPYYTARESGVMWLAIYRYVNAEAETAGTHAEWFGSLLANTQVSFMRHAIGGNGVSVSNKAGWYATPVDSEYDMDSFSEAGIVSENGHDYLLTVMTDAAYKGAIENPFEDIIQAVWSARADIAIEE